ncbi:hypothetical protein KY284_033145 [Solanum tuberosum]|nr:hypothetical protein KY284_033145 [Solanum tuberosum]
MSHQEKANFQEILTLGSLTILKVDIKNVCCLPPYSVAPNWEKFDMCVSDSKDAGWPTQHNGPHLLEG